MAQIIELRKLSEEFYRDHPRSDYPEMEAKVGRPYAVLLVRIDGVCFAIPLRTNIRHSYCYKFRTSDRKTESATGIDFSKAVVVSKETYLGQKTDINDKEYLELQKKSYFIVNRFQKYVHDYIDYKKNGGNEHLAKRYAYCTLKYFDEILLK
jgi:hypothetical protein